MNTTHRLIPILLLLLAGCEEQAPVPAQQASPEATDQTQPTVLPLAPTTPPDATLDATEQTSEITGKVVHVIDGDTIDTLTADITTIRVRLNGIDAPETGQPFGKNAKQFLSEFIGGQTVRVVKHGEDRYGRTIGDIYFKHVPGPDFLLGTVLPDWMRENPHLRVKHIVPISRDGDTVELHAWYDVAPLPRFTVDMGN